MKMKMRVRVEGGGESNLAPVLRGFQYTQPVNGTERNAPRQDKEKDTDTDTDKDKDKDKDNDEDK